MKKRLTIILALTIIFLTGCNPTLISTNFESSIQIYSSIEEISDRKIKNLIIVIGDGMGPQHIAAGEMVYNKNYAFTNWNQTYVDTDYLGTNGIANNTTESAAAATALATGHLTYAGYVGCNKEKNFETILDYAHFVGMKTGIVTTDSLYGATPAGFSAHSASRDNKTEIIESQITSNVNVFVGPYSGTVAGYKNQIEENGYTYITNYNDKDLGIGKDKVLAMFGLNYYGIDISLKSASQYAIDVLENDNGYCLMIEQAYIDKYSHNNDFANMVKSQNSLNDTVDYLLDRYKDCNNTAIIVTGDHETGGLRVNEENNLGNNYENVFYSFGSTSHTNAYIPMFYYGFDLDIAQYSSFGSNHLIKNSNIYDIDKYVLGIK